MTEDLERCADCYITKPYKDTIARLTIALDAARDEIALLKKALADKPD